MDLFTNIPSKKKGHKIKKTQRTITMMYRLFLKTLRQTVFFGQNLSNKAIIKTKQVQPLPFFLPLLPSSPLFLFLFLSSVFELFGRKTLANSNDGKFDRFVLKQSARCSSLKVYVENRAENMFCWIFENVNPE